MRFFSTGVSSLIVQLAYLLLVISPPASAQSSDYARCRNAGYSHSSCDGQNRSYVECRRAGYRHSSCDGQNSSYVACRRTGYRHSSCDGQNHSYVACRRTGYRHSSCDGQTRAYLDCRHSGYSHHSCDGQGRNNRERAFRVFNETGLTLEELYLSPSGSSSWGPNDLSRLIRSGNSVEFTISSPNCIYDVLAIFSNGRRIEEDQIDTCDNGGITLR